MLPLRDIYVSSELITPLSKIILLHQYHSITIRLEGTRNFHEEPLDLLRYVIIILPSFQDEDEADTVGCCTLKVENVTCLPPNKLQVLIFILYT